MCNRCPSTLGLVSYPQLSVTREPNPTAFLRYRDGGARASHRIQLNMKKQEGFHLWNSQKCFFFFYKILKYFFYRQNCLIVTIFFRIQICTYNEGISVSFSQDVFLWVRTTYLDQEKSTRQNMNNYFLAFMCLFDKNCLKK